MSQEKAQLIAPLGIVTFSGVTATGVITATSLSGNITGSASSIIQGTSITAGVVTASSFAGNLTGNIQRLADSAPNISVGVVTATSFSGNLTGSVTDLTATPDITVGIVTATRLKTAGTLTGDVTGNITGDVTGVATGNVTGNVDGNVTGDATGNASGHAGGLGINYNGGWAGAGTSQISVGVITATSFYGDGSTLDGVSGGPVSAQSVTINGASTAIDLSNGNLIYVTQSADTTVSFANSENGNVYFIRTKDDNSTARTITWPDRIKWEGGSAPTLLSSPYSNDGQVFLLVTRDMGVTWYGKEIYKNGGGGALWAWGDNEYGGIGNNTSTTNYSSPVQIPSTWSTIDSQSYGRGQLATKGDNTLWTWGRNQYGQLGQNNTTDHSSPVQIPGTTWGEEFSHQRVSFAIKTNGTLWTWGQNDQGQLGHNTTNNNISSPTQIPGSWSKCMGAAWAGAVKTDGTMWCMGYNASGALGQNNKTSYSSPAQVGTDTTWDGVASCGSNDTLYGTKTDGTLWSWGTNGAGQLGINVNTQRSSPTQIPGTTWSKISGGPNFAAAIRTDGTLWTWGSNGNGKLGLNQHTGEVSSPTQIPGTTWDDVDCGYYGGVATKTDGTLWAWGKDAQGQMGQNTISPAYYSSPTQIGTGTDWDKPFYGFGVMGARILE